MDDFGTGYSSLAQFKHLPVDEIKIDKSFVMELRPDSDDAAIVRSTIDLGHNLGVKVVAEGVETPEAWRLLMAMGCDLAQGYLISPPLPADEVVARLASLNDALAARRDGYTATQSPACAGDAEVSVSPICRAPSRRIVGSAVVDPSLWPSNVR